MAKHDIGTAAKLPLAVAIEVVAQGIRIRLGRSLVTLAGVVCGIAFLASVLTGGVVKAGVAGEQAARDESARMIALIEAESGPLRGWRLAVIGTPSEVESRLIATSVAAGAERSTTLDGATVVVLAGPAPADLAARLAVAPKAVLAALVSPAGLKSVSLTWRPQLGEVEERARVASEERRRSWWVTGIALAVTAIGIANAMLMSVTERFREIGTMKCLGALSSFIRRIFFLESAFIGLIGGVAGVILGALITILGYGASFGFALVIDGTDWSRLAVLLFLGLIASVVLAVGAAIYPATVASRMRPSAALRSSV